MIPGSALWFFSGFYLYGDKAYTEQRSCNISSAIDHLALALMEILTRFAAASKRSFVTMCRLQSLIRSQPKAYISHRASC